MSSTIKALSAAHQGTLTPTEEAFCTAVFDDQESADDEDDLEFDPDYIDP